MERGKNQHNIQKTSIKSNKMTMHAASLPYTCIIHVKMVQHVYTQMLEFTVFKHNLPMQK